MMNLDRQTPAAAHWSRQEYRVLFATSSEQRPSERFALVVEDDGDASEILAFLVANRIDAEWELENLVVAAVARRQGLGTRLLNEFITHVRNEKGSAIFLEVRESNQNARALYRKAGFEETGLRKSYYADPAEDAILCRLSL
jgi:ribosomal-protein-alanine N-acetyltransferase